MSFKERESSRSHILSVGVGPLVDEGTSIFSVTTKTLDNFCRENQIELIDYLKIDTETFEAHVLRGARETLSKTRYLHLEITLEGNENYTFSQINALLYSQDYSFQLIYFRNYADRSDGPIPVGDFMYQNLRLAQTI